MRAICLTCSLLCLACAGLWLAGFRFNVTPSMPTGVYRLHPGQAARGDAVCLCLPASTFSNLALERGYLRPGSCPSGVQPLLKRVIGMPGDVVSVSVDGIRIAGVLQPDSHIAKYDSHARPMPPSALSSGMIPAGMALALSDSNDGGFDGRYFGLVPLNTLQRVTPVWTLATKGE